MGCAFCASTIGGKVRDLLPSELLGQVIAAEHDVGERISNIVMMGIGEPLDNYANVIKFLKLVGLEDGINIGYRHISVSTCGIVPRIYDLAKLDMPITLSISLHSSRDEERSEIMPVNRRWGVGELLTACRDYYKSTGRRISFEYTLIGGKNDSLDDAKALAKLLIPVHAGIQLQAVLLPIMTIYAGFGIAIGGYPVDAQAAGGIQLLETVLTIDCQVGAVLIHLS